MDDVSYGALALALALIGGVYTWFAYQRRGLGPALRGAAITLLPIAAWLTDTLRMFGRIADAIGDWATRLVFSPSVWVGVIVAGVAVLLYGAGRMVDARGGGEPRPRPREVAPSATTPDAAAPTRRRGKPASDDDGLDDDVAAILRKRGIS